MSTDYARWLENEIAMVLTFDRPEPATSAPETPETPEEGQ